MQAGEHEHLFMMLVTLDAREDLLFVGHELLKMKLEFFKWAVIGYN